MHRRHKDPTGRHRLGWTARAQPTGSQTESIGIVLSAGMHRRLTCHRGIDERRSVLCQPVQSRAGRHEHQPEDVGRGTYGGRLLSKTGRNTSARSPPAGKPQRWDSARARFVGPERRRVAHHRSPGRRQGRATLRGWSGFDLVYLVRWKASAARPTNRKTSVGGRVGQSTSISCHSWNASERAPRAGKRRRGDGVGTSAPIDDRICKYRNASVPQKPPAGILQRVGA